MTTHKHLKNTNNQKDAKISGQPTMLRSSVEPKIQTGKQAGCTEPCLYQQQGPLAMFETDQLTPCTKGEKNQVFDYS